MEIRDMKADDYDEIFALWQITSKRALSEADNEENICKYIARNSGLSQVAVIDGKIIGTLLAGHDGRRGFFHHMAVLPEFRRHGIARSLVQTALEKLSIEGIAKSHLFVFCDNKQGQAFWESLGFTQRDDIFVYSRKE
ncbi:MAG: GNAT family N-acetyltransferase [Bacillota bacterium]|nr:GNAT family N-acetyltransferase [Bacillota bacterium]